MYRIIVIDNHPLIREGVVSIVNDSGNFIVERQFSFDWKLIDVLSTIDFDLLILDPENMNEDMCLFLRKIKRVKSNIKILINSSLPSFDQFHRTYKCGIHGFILKDDPLNTIITALEFLMNNQDFYSPRVMQYLVKSDYAKEGLEHILTKREYEVFKYIVNGYENKQISNLLNIKSRTVHYHKSNLLQKLNISNKSELFEIAHKNNLFIKV